MILCAERFARELPKASAGTLLVTFPACSGACQAGITTGRGAVRRTHARECGPRDLSASRRGRRLAGRAETTTS